MSTFTLSKMPFHSCSCEDFSLNRSNKQFNKKMENTETDIFERLKKGEIIPPNDPEAYKMRKLLLLRKSCLFR